MKKPVAGLVPIIAIFFGFAAAICFATGAYFAGAFAVDIGLFVWFCLKWGLSGRDASSKEDAPYFIGMLATLAPVTLLSFFDIGGEIYRGTAPSVKQLALLTSILGLIFRSLPQIQEAARTCLLKEREWL